MKRTIFASLLFVLFFLFNIFSTVSIPNAMLLNCNPFIKIKNFFVDLFKPKVESTITSPGDDKYVYLGGQSIGFTISSDGVIIVGVSEVNNGEYIDSPGRNAGLKPGDILKKLDGIEITNSGLIAEILKAGQKNYFYEINRNGEIITGQIRPSFDCFSKSLKLGLWVRDNASGVGTLTYINSDGSFVALGHSVTDIDTGTDIPLKDGIVYKTSIIGVTKGQRGTPGELKGVFLKNAEIGKLTKNESNGLNGIISDDKKELFSLKEIKLGDYTDVTPGKAIMYSCINGQEVKPYNIEIIKVNNINSKTKNMVIRVIDDELIELCGGIVQGMSGSPIVQNDKLVGSLTHVFVNDPTKGYAIFASNL